MQVWEASISIKWEEPEHKYIYDDREKYQTQPVHLNLAMLVLIANVSTVGIQHCEQKQFAFSDYTTSHMKLRLGTQDRNMEAGTEAVAMEGCCPLVYLLDQSILRLVSYTIQDHLPIQGYYHPGRLGPSTSIMIQE